VRNETKARFLDKTEGAPVCAAEMYCVVEDGVEYRLQVVWRSSNGAQHCRDGYPLPKNLGQLLFQI
jgi:hypothetical protein